ncbi:MAG: ABC transporter ATP-binding protein [Gemmatimonadetes bacterium]|nr:ABC transporter ATP-binding protein [Gemmatimonadota bacterium]
MPAAIARLSAVSFRYASGRRGVEAIDLAVHPGDVLVVLGPNGSGKSTLLGLLAGDLVPSQGQARVFGQAADRLAGADRVRRGICVDEPAHADALSGRANALLFARANGCGRADAEARVDALLGRLGLGADADARCGAYSFGMRRRLQLVEALAHAPDLLFLDEPTTGLDIDAVTILRELIVERSRAGAASVIATNDVHGVTPAATRIAFLHDGRKIADATPAALLERVRGTTRIEVTMNGALRDKAIVFPPESTAVFRDGGCTVETRRGTAILPAVCAALVEAGAEIRGIRVREPDLVDVFRDLTGASLASTDG